MTDFQPLRELTDYILTVAVSDIRVYTFRKLKTIIIGSFWTTHYRSTFDCFCWQTYRSSLDVRSLATTSCLTVSVLACLQQGGYAITSVWLLVRLHLSVDAITQSYQF